MEKIKVLVADEDQGTIETVQGIFEAKYPKATVKGATSPTKALAIMSQEVPDIVLIDVAFPDTDGIPLALEMRHDKSLKDVPIIYLTEQADEKSLKKSKIKKEDYLLKPFDSDTIIRSVKAAAVKSKHMSHPIYPIGYVSLDFIALFFPIAAATYYLITETHIPAEILTPYALLTIPTAAEYAKALLVWALTYMILLICIDFALKRGMPEIHEEKHVLPDANLDYWRRHRMKLLTQAMLPVWMITFIPTYFLKPTLFTDLIYLVPTSMLGIYLVGYHPKR